MKALRWERDGEISLLARRLLQAADRRDGYTFRHTGRVVEHALFLAAELGLTEKEKQALYFGALFHDAGRLDVDESILNKPGPLVEAEWQSIWRHPLWGAEKIKGITALEEIVSLVRGHHERCDGSGYPDGLKGDRIPLGARILGLADSFDAMTSPRPYRPARTPDEAIMELQAGAGRLYDPALVEAFLRVLERQVPDTH